jgi:hypothetical protein
LENVVFDQVIDWCQDLITDPNLADVFEALSALKPKARRGGERRFINRRRCWFGGL